MSDIIGLKVRARQIRNATLEGENTALRVGSLLEDIVDCLDGTGGGGDSSDSLVINSLLNTGVKIATFKKGNDITSIYAPSAGGGGGGGGGGSAYDDTDLWNALNALDRTLDSTTDLANDEKARLDDLVKGIGDDISGRMKDALDFAAWIQGNFPQGEVTFRSGWDTKAQQFLQTVGLWDTDAETTLTMWSNFRQSYNDIMMTVSAVTESEDFTTFLQSAITQGISEGTISINLDTVYANKDEVDDVITWLYSGLKNQSSSDKTFNQLVSAARSGDSTGITELRTLIELLHNNLIVATTNLAAKVDDALAELYISSGSNWAKAHIFSTIDENSQNIATIVTAATGDSTTATIATKFANWKAGLATKSYVDGATASLVAANDYNAAAIVAMINDAGSNVTIGADHVDLSGLDVLMRIKDPEGNINMLANGLILSNRSSADYSPYIYDVTADGYSGEFKVVCTPVVSPGDPELPPITFRVSPTLGVSQFTGTGSSSVKHFLFDSETCDILQGMISASIADPSDEYVSLARGKVEFNTDGSGQLANGAISWNTSGNLQADTTSSYGYTVKIKPGGANGSVPNPYNGVSRYLKIGSYYFLFLNGVLVYCDASPRTRWTGQDAFDDQGVEAVLTDDGELITIV